MQVQAYFLVTYDKDTVFWSDKDYKFKNSMIMTKAYISLTGQRKLCLLIMLNTIKQIIEKYHMSELWYQEKTEKIFNTLP